MLAPQVHRASSDKQPTPFIWLARATNKRLQIICLGKESRFGGRTSRKPSPSCVGNPR